jgi:alpha-glucosidase
MTGLQLGVGLRTLPLLLVLLASACSGAALHGGAQRQVLQQRARARTGGASLSATTSVGAITAFASDPAQGLFNITCEGNVQFQVIFYTPTTIRVWMALDGNFSDPAGPLLVVAQRSPPVPASSQETTSTYAMQARGSTVRLEAHKNPLLFAMYDGETLLWQETVGLSWNDTTTTQTLAAAQSEYFFGGGMQNGRFSHKGHQIRISTDGNWADGGNPNAAPFYLSTGGYGVFRNTFAPAVYNFAGSPINTAHNESRFDAFFFAGDMKQVLNLYTLVTGRPFLPPIYGLGLGDSDCYHNDRHGNSTRVVLAVADEYRSRDMPGAWFLPNDGYGCGFGEDNTSFPTDFEDLDYVVAELHKRGFYTGLWSSTGLPNITREVAGSGVRIGKTDVGWVGAGYDYAFSAVEMVVQGIEQNSDARRFIWTVEGWAGTQRNAVVWCGDDYGTFDYVRWQIATFVGTSLSGIGHVSGDINGIFGGTGETYIRDLQFKCFMTVLMSMSGWAQNPDKQPWTFGEPYESISRR